MAKSLVRFGASPILTLPTGATTPYMLYSSRKKSGWAGNYCRVVRASDSAALDVGFKSNNTPNGAAADTHGAATTIRVDKLYDQSGNGLDLVQTTAANRPEFDIRNEFRGMRGVSFTGDWLAAPPGTAKTLQSATTLALNRNAMTVYLVIAPRFSYPPLGWFDFTDLAFATSRLRMRITQVSDTKGLTVNGGSDVLAWSPPSQPCIVSWSMGATQIMRVNGRELTSATGWTSLVLQSLIMGKILGVNEGLAGEIHLFAAYQAAHTSATMQLVEAELTRCFNPVMGATKRLLSSGASIDHTYLVPAAQSHLWIGGYGTPVESDYEVYSLAGIGGSSIVGEYSIRAWITPFCNPSQFNVYMCDTGSNALNNVYGSRAEAEAAADNVYDTATLPLVTYMLANGVQRMVVPPTIVRGDFSTTNFAEYARLRYNSRIASGAVAGGYSTMTIPSTLSNYDDMTYFNGDRVHMTVAGNTEQAAMRKVPIVA